MAFQFSLAAVLRIRELVEEREERLLQQILFEVAQAGERIARNEQDMAGCWARLGKVHDRPVAGHQLHAAYGEVQELTEGRKELEGRLEKLKQLRDKQLAVYEAAHRDREMLTDMRREKQSAYDVEAARSEQKLIDDNFMTRRSRG